MKIKFPIKPFSPLFDFSASSMTIFNEYLNYIDSVNLLYEGLITSYPINKIIKHLNHKGYKIYSYDKDMNIFKVLIYHNSENDLKRQLTKLSQSATVFGWVISKYASGIIYEPTLQSYLLAIDNLSINYTYLTFEAIYDIELKQIPNNLYHLTPKENGDKILKYGLTPKYQEKREYHPDRIYFFDKYDENMLIQLATQLKNADKNSKYKSGIYYLLNISNPQHKIPGLRLFKDPHYLDKGVYTLQAIDPTIIKKLKEINLNK